MKTNMDAKMMQTSAMHFKMIIAKPITARTDSSKKRSFIKKMVFTATVLEPFSRPFICVSTQFSKIILVHQTWQCIALVKKVILMCENKIFNKFLSFRVFNSKILKR